MNTWKVATAVARRLEATTPSVHTAEGGWAR